MNEPPLSDQDDFQEELEVLRSILKKNLHKLNEDPFLGTQLEFWMESARFLEINLEIWESVGNAYKHEQAMERMRHVLEVLQQLIDKLNHDSGDGNSDPPPIEKK